MKRELIVERLFDLKDEKYAAMQKKIIPTTEKEIIGVRTPQLKDLAKEIHKDEDTGEFLKILPHQYFDEDQLQAFLISLMKDFDTCIDELENFLPYIDNWATCDQLSPKMFKKNKEKLLPYIYRWISSDQTYTVRFAIGMLMEHFLDEDFKKEYADLVASIRSDEYYINMMIAWYFATGLAKQYEEILPYLEEKKLAEWTHNKTISKAIESYRITPEQKYYLKTLKIRNK